MVGSNVEIVKVGFGALSSTDVDALMPLVHPDFVMTTPSDLASEPDTYRGHEGVRRYFDSWFEAMEEIRIEPDEFIEIGERVIVPFTFTARGKRTGIEVPGTPAVQLWELQDGLAIRLDFFATVEEAVAVAREREGNPD